MPVITINGPIGCGSVTVGQMVSQQLNINFVDRLVFTQAARLVGTPVGALIDKEQRRAIFWQGNRDLTPGNLRRTLW